MQGVAVFLEEFSTTAEGDSDISATEAAGRLTGEVLRSVRDSVRQGFLDWSPRILLAMYKCEIQASSRFHSISNSRKETGLILGRQLKYSVKSTAL